MLYLPVERRYGIAHMAALLVMLYCLKKFDQNIVSISSHDVEEYTRDGDIYHNGHLGVALENGDFFIL